MVAVGRSIGGFTQASQLQGLAATTSNLGGAESLATSKAGQIVSARMMESQILHQLAGSVGGGFSKGTMASACLDARHFSFSHYATGAFSAAAPGWSSEGVSLSR